MELPLISVIVPIYKVEEYLDRCIKSLAEQTYYKLEIILVDDGSPDNCPKKCEEWSRKERRIKVIHKQNGGLADARNVGLEVATGEYILFVDSDDWVSPDYVAGLYQAAYSTDSDICECEIVKTDREISIDDVAGSTPVCYETEDALKLLIQDSVFHQYVWNKIYRTECLRGIPFVKGKINEDEFWTYQVFGRANKVAKIQKQLYVYFQRSESIMGIKYSSKRLDALEAKTERQQYIEKNFPALRLLARTNLILSCIYSGQMAILHMDGSERDQALERARTYFEIAAAGIKNVSMPAKQKVWITLATISFTFTCKLRNLLKIGF